MSSVAKLTSWEEEHLSTIELFCVRVREGIAYFMNNEDKFKRMADDSEDSGFTEDRRQDWLKFREIVLDLYSVLDYSWYLLYCHFQNGGQPDLSERCTQVGFPYRIKGVKSSDTPEHDQGKKFMKDKLKLILGGKYGEDTHFWKEISQIILSTQPKQMVNQNGTPIGGISIQPGDGESFAFLHFYRNCAAHRNLIKFMPKKSWVQINQITRETKLVNERHENEEGYFYKELDKGYWIQLPDFGDPQRDTSRLLLEVLDQLLKSVVKVTSRLLRSTFLLPPAKVILNNQVECKLESSFTTKEGRFEAEIIATVNNRDPALVVKKMGEGKCKDEAEENACVLILQSLIQKDVRPKSPFSCFTSHILCVFPQLRSISRGPCQTYSEVLEKLKAELAAGDTEMSSDSEHLDAALNSIISDGQTENDTDVGEAVAKKAIEEGIRLGLIELQDMKWPHRPIPLMQSPSKNHRGLLNEFSQKMKNLGMEVKQSSIGPTAVEQRAGQFETKLTLIITSKTDGTLTTWFKVISKIRSGQGKSGAGEAAAKDVVEQLVDKKLIELS